MKGLDGGKKLSIDHRLMRRVQFNNLGFGLMTGILHKKSKCGIHNHLIL